MDEKIKQEILDCGLIGSDVDSIILIIEENFVPKKLLQKQVKAWRECAGESYPNFSEYWRGVNNCGEDLKKIISQRPCPTCGKPGHLAVDHAGFDPETD